MLASLIINEIRSILENFVEAGYNVPKILVNGLEVADKVVNKDNDTENRFRGRVIALLLCCGVATERRIMIITGMAHFESVCKKKLVEWYRKNRPEVEIELDNVFVVWSCKTLQNYKCLVSTTISGGWHLRGVYI